MSTKGRTIHPMPADQVTAHELEMKMTSLLNRVHTLAYEIFERRNGENGHDLDDWLQAERDLGLLVGRIEETPTKIRIRIERPEFTAAEITVHAESLAITVEGATAQELNSENQCATESSERTFFGRYQLPSPIDPGRVTATLQDGVLEIVGQRVEVPENAVPVKDEANGASARAITDKRSAAA